MLSGPSVVDVSFAPGGSGSDVAEEWVDPSPHLLIALSVNTRSEYTFLQLQSHWISVGPNFINVRCHKTVTLLFLTFPAEIVVCPTTILCLLKYAFPIGTLVQQGNYSQWEILYCMFWCAWNYLTFFLDKFCLWTILYSVMGFRSTSCYKKCQNIFPKLRRNSWPDPWATVPLTVTPSGSTATPQTAVTRTPTPLTEVTRRRTEMRATQRKNHTKINQNLPSLWWVFVWEFRRRWLTL